MSPERKYSINLHVKYDFLERIDIPRSSPRPNQRHRLRTRGRTHSVDFFPS
jgi:hypothetical protein